MDQSVTRTQYDPGTIRKFKRMSCVAALLMVLLLLRGDRGGGVVEPSPASPVAKSMDFDEKARTTPFDWPALSAALNTSNANASGGALKPLNSPEHKAKKRRT